MSMNNTYAQLQLPIILEEKLDSSCRRIVLPNAHLILHENFWGKAQSDEIFEKLYKQTPWQEERIFIYGQEKTLPRLTAWYGDQGAIYTYSKIKMSPYPWTPLLESIRNQVEAFCKEQFNSVLLNLYRHGGDSISWHSDDEYELGNNPPIASVSFGGSRCFKMKHKCDSSLKLDIQLSHGSLLLMKGETQHFWQHHVPKTRKKIDPRINLTFRKILL